MASRDALVGVLRRHQRKRNVRDLHVHCLCTWASAQTGPTGAGEHLEHQANEILRLLDLDKRRGKRP